MKIYILIEDCDGNIDVRTYSSRRKAQETFKRIFSEMSEGEEKDDFSRNADAAAQIGYACFDNYSIRLKESELDED